VEKSISCTAYVRAADAIGSASKKGFGGLNRSPSVEH